MDEVEQHRRIVEHGVHVMGVSFRTDATAASSVINLENDGFFARQLSSGQRVLHVHVRREQGGIWADRNDIESFLRSVSDALHETIVIAHELGHAHHEIERRRTGLSMADLFAAAADRTQSNLRSKAPITRVEADCIYREEQVAWEHGARLLDAQGFDGWERFQEQARSSLQSYESAIKTCYSSWEPHHANAPLCGSSLR